MKIPSILLVVSISILVSGCSREGSESGDGAIQELRSTIGHGSWGHLNNCRYKWVQVRDTYTQYFQFKFTDSKMTSMFVRELDLEECDILPESSL